MKRLLASISLVAVTTTAALPAPVAKPTAKPAPSYHVKAPPVHVAPADEYFGKLKLSVLGIRNTIKDVGANLDIDQARWTALASKAAFAEDAMRDWEKKYPQDTWLAKTVFALERMYAKLDSSDGRTHAIAAMHWLIADYPKTWYGKTGKRELAAGKVGHPVDTAASSASPSPDATAAQIAAPAPLVSNAPAPLVSNAPAPLVSNAPAPAAVNAAGNAVPDQPAPAAVSPFPVASGSPGPGYTP